MSNLPRPPATSTAAALAIMGVQLGEETTLRSNVEAQVEVDAHPDTQRDAQRIVDARRALQQLEEAFDVACDELADAPAKGPGAVAPDVRAGLIRSRDALERKVADASKKVSTLQATAKSNRAHRLKTVLALQKAAHDREREARKAEETARRAAMDADGTGAIVGDGSSRGGVSRHAALLNGAVSAGSATLLSARRAQRVLASRMEPDQAAARGGRRPVGGASAAAGSGVGGGIEGAPPTDAVLDYRGGAAVPESALRITVKGVRRGRDGGTLQDDGNAALFAARQHKRGEAPAADANAASRRATKSSRAEGAAAAAATTGNNPLVDDDDDDDIADDDPDYIARLASRALAAADDDGNDEGGTGAATSSEGGDDEDEEDLADVKVLGDITVTARVWVNLLDYQQVGLKWLCERHLRATGGILGDEMGLGKTIQIAALLSALHHSGKLARPALVVAPLTVLQQWVGELRKWAPELRTVVLHSSGSATVTKDQLLAEVAGTPAVVVSTYQTVAMVIDGVVAMRPMYVILDEGHKISNPDTSVTIAMKAIATPHRLILSGSPIQNTLKELWCLFDFVAPGTLGTMSSFVSEFEEPIKASRTPNASQMVIQTAIECARALRDHIAPFLLRRMKKDVNTMLPPKHEKVVRCLLTDGQLQEYLNVLDSAEVRDFKRRMNNLRTESGRVDRDGRLFSTGGLALNPNAGQQSRSGMTDGMARQAFKALGVLRAVTNHVDLFTVKADHRAEGGESGYVSFRSNNPVNLDGSGKLMALDVLLQQWRAAGNRALVFTQTRTMLDIIENLVEQRGYTYFRMDGTTASHHRQPLISRFNNDSSVFVALLTTRVGGLGVNLVGADRVVIFDPDWNPVTDEQARERAWRIGQTREVQIFRMVTTGTVEEHILHRQLAKLFVAEKVLSDPSLQRSFHLASLADSFLLGAEYLPRLDRSCRHFVSNESFSMADELKRDQVIFEEHGNTTTNAAAAATDLSGAVPAAGAGVQQRLRPMQRGGEAAATASSSAAAAKDDEKKKEDADDDKKEQPPQRNAAGGSRIIIRGDRVYSTGPKPSEGFSDRLAALEGSRAPAPSTPSAGRTRSLTSAGMASAVAAEEPKPPAAGASVQRIEAAPSLTAAGSIATIEDMHVTGGGSGDLRAPSSSVAGDAGRGGQQPNAPDAGAPPGAAVDPDAETNILQSLMDGDVPDAADSGSLAARLARIAAQRTLHRATTSSQPGGASGSQLAGRSASNVTAAASPRVPSAAGSSRRTAPSRRR